MPDMDGWSFRAEQRQDPFLASIPVIILSADSAAEREARRPGVVAALIKPVDSERLLELVAKHC
jgi:CheY-like chemotaxis protein